MDFDLDRSLMLLERTPKVLDSLLRDLPDPWVRANEGGDSFSAFDVVGHLIDGEETDWLVRARIVLAQQPNTPFAPYDRFRHRTRNAGRTLAALLDEFAGTRRENLGVLRSWELTPQQLDLRGTHPRLGSVTLRNLLATWVAHDLGHLAQISRVLAKQFRDAVGPWVAFLPVLTDHSVPVGEASALDPRDADPMTGSAPTLRFARPVRDLARSAAMYRDGLGLPELGRFEDHAGFDGVMLGHRGSPCHFELTHCRHHPVVPAPTAEDLIVLYLPDSAEWERTCRAMTTAGFHEVPSFNPYWARSGRTFEDPDHYRFVLQCAPNPFARR